MKKRSLGVKIFGTLFALQGAWQLTWTLLNHGDMTYVLALWPIFVLLGFTALYNLIVSFGLFLFQTWARPMALVSAVVIAPIFGIIAVMSIGRFPVTLGTVVGLGMVLGWMWGGLVFWYFLRPGVKAQFQRAHSN